MIIASREIPQDIVTTFFINSGWKGALTFSKVNQYANALFKSEELLRYLIFSHFGCRLSKTVTPQDQYFRLSRARAGYSNPIPVKLFSVHEKETEFLCLSADGTKALFHASDKETAVLKDLTSGICTPALSGYEELDWYNGLMNFTEIKSDGTRALLVSYDTLALWDLTKDTCIYTFDHKESQHTISCFQVNADWTMAVSADWHGKLKRWDLTAGVCTGTFDHEELIACMHMNADGTSILLGLEDGALKHQNLINDKCITFPAHDLSIDCVQMSADGTKALSTSDKILKFWNLTTLECIATFYADDAIICLQMSADGTSALSGSEKGFLIFWDLTKNEYTTLDCPFMEVNFNYIVNPITCVTMNADGLTAFSLSGDGTLKCLNLAPSNTDRVADSWRKCMSSAPHVYSL